MNWLAVVFGILFIISFGIFFSRFLGLKRMTSSKWLIICELSFALALIVEIFAFENSGFSVVVYSGLAILSLFTCIIEYINNKKKV